LAVSLTADGGGTKITKVTKITKQSNCLAIFEIFVNFVPPPWRVSASSEQTFEVNVCNR
jgi:hypothetical protein